jgi:hypothetical protein
MRVAGSVPAVLLAVRRWRIPLPAASSGAGEWFNGASRSPSYDGDDVEWALKDDREQAHIARWGPSSRTIAGGDAAQPVIEVRTYRALRGQRERLMAMMLGAYTSGWLTDPESGTACQSTGHPCLGIR